MIQPLQNCYAPDVMERIHIKKGSALYNFCHTGKVRDKRHARQLKDQCARAMQQINGCGWSYNYLADIWDHIDKC